MEYWSVSFRVNETQNRDDRYNEVLAGTTIPEGCQADQQAAHDSVWADMVANGEPAKPYAVYLTGWLEGESSGYDTNVVQGA
jgi:hypothetical protein